MPDRPWVAETARRIRIDGVRPEAEPILIRLTTDPRMNAVWTQLTRRSRTDPTQFFYPAVRDKDGPQLDAEAAQHHAMGMLLFHAFRSARAKRVATPIEEVEALRQRILADAITLRRVADEIKAMVANASAYDRDHFNLAQFLADAQALRRVAVWRDHDAGRLRGPDDPLTTKYKSAHPVAEAVQRDIAGILQTEFGQSMPKQAAIVAAVALGLVDAPKERGSRAALLKSKKGTKSQSAK